MLRTNFIFKFCLPVLLAIPLLLAPTAAIANPKRCEAIFSTEFPDLLAKSGLELNDIKFTTYHRKNNRVWIELRKSDESLIGRIALSPGGRHFFSVEIVLLEAGYEGKGLGFLLYQAAAHVAAKRYNRVLSASRDRHTNDAEQLWIRMVESGAAAIRFLPLLELVNYLNAATPIQPITPEEVSSYVDRFGQSIYIVRKDSGAAHSIGKIYERRAGEIINTE